ncbi:MAG: inositol monophosphatase family protein [Myxococcota bacterium]
MTDAASTFDLDRIGGRRALDALISEILAAGEFALSLSRSGFATVDKPDGSPVTEADKGVEARLRAHVEQAHPTASFLGEESGEKEGDGLRFIVDPIDGTRAFVRGLSTWSVLCGIEYEGVPVVGIAFMPAEDDFYLAVAGEGARRNGRAVGVGSVEALDRATVAHGALNQFTLDGRTNLLEALAKETYSQRGLHDFDGYRQLLLGRVDAMVDPGVTGWDICAAAVLVREAGGRLTSLEGEETVFGGGAIASNGKIHDPLLALTARCRMATGTNSHD